MRLNDLVSVIVLTYNSSNKVLLTLESIKQQKYKNIEIIISDDASSDDTVSIIEHYIKKNKYTKIVFIKNEINLGTVANYQNALLKANGVYIKPIGAGDLLYSKNTISNYVNKLHESGRDFIFGFNCSYRWNSENEEIEFIKEIINPEPYYINDYIDTGKAIHRILKRGHYISGSTFFYKKMLIEENLLPGTVIYTEDIVQVLLVLKNVQFANLNEYVVLYEVGEGLSTSNKFKSALVKDHISFFSWLLQNQYFKKYNIIKDKIFYFKNYNSLVKKIIYYLFMRPILLIEIIFERKINKNKRKQFNKKYIEQLSKEDNLKDIIEKHYLQK